MKIKTSDLIGSALDWAVAKCLGAQFALVMGRGAVIETNGIWIADRPYVLLSDWNTWADKCDGAPFDSIVGVWRPSINWSQGGPIIEREHINTVRGNDLYFPKGNEEGDHYEPLWLASTTNRIGISVHNMHGPTPLIAAMRCYVASKLGDEIEVPKELFNDS